MDQKRYKGPLLTVIFAAISGIAVAIAATTEGHSMGVVYGLAVYFGLGAISLAMNES